MSVEEGHRLKRQRTSQACDSCRRRKVRCNSEKPVCGQCTKAGLVCVYTEQRKPNSQNRSSPLGARIDRIEQLLVRLAQHAGAQLSPSDPLQNHEGGEQFSSDEDTSPQEMNQGPAYGPPQEDIPILRLENPSVDDDMKPTIYQHNIFSSMMSPPNLARMSDRIGDPSFAKKFTGAIQKVFQSRDEELNKLMLKCHSGPSQIDPAVENVCLQMHHESDSDFINTLVRPDEWSEMLEQNPTAYAIARPSLIMVLLALMLNKGHLHQFSDTYIREQIVFAFTQATRAWSVSGLAHPTSCLFRALVVYAIGSVIFSPTPQTYYAIAIALRIGQHMGLNRAEVYEDMAPSSRRRTLDAWWILYTYDSSLAIIGGHPPGMRSSEISAPLPGPDLPASSDLHFLQYEARLSFIYDKLYERIFSVTATKRSSQQIITDIRALNEDLDKWHETIPASLIVSSSERPVHSNNSNSHIMDLSMNLKSHMEMLYHILKIQMYATPAFMPSFFKVPGSSGTDTLSKESNMIATTAARSLMKLDFEQNREYKPTSFLSCYSLIAADMVLFLNSLKYPLGEHFLQDFEMIRTMSLVRDPNLASCSNNAIWGLELEAMLKVRERFLGANPHQVQTPESVGKSNDHLMVNRGLDALNSPFEFIPWVDPAIDLFPEVAAAEVTGENCNIC